MTSWEPGNESQAEPAGPPLQQPADGVTVADLQPSTVPRRRGRHVWIGVSVAVLVTLMVTTAIIAASSSSSPSSPDGHSAIALLRGAPASTTATGSARSSGGATLTFEGKTQTILKYKGASDFRTRSARLSMTIGGAVARVRLVGGVEYFSQSLVPLPRGAHWVKITSADAGITAQDVASAGTEDPSSGLQFMRAVSGNPRLVGSETLDGTHVAHYKFTLDLVPLMDLLRKSSNKLGGSQLAAGLKKLERYADLHHVGGEAWLDSAGRVRRFEYRIDISSNGRTAHEVADLRFSHFGEPVTVGAPPAADIVPFSEVPDLFKQLERRPANSSGSAS